MADLDSEGPIEDTGMVIIEVHGMKLVVNKWVAEDMRVSEGFYKDDKQLWEQ